MFFVLMPLFIYFLYLIWCGNKKWVFWVGFVYGAMFSFHFSQLPLLGVVVALFYLKRKSYGIYNWAVFVVGALLPNLTLIWENWKLILWVPYRILKYGGREAVQSLAPFNEFLGYGLVWDKSLWWAGSLVFLLVFIHFVYTNRSKIKSDFLMFFIVLSFGLVFTANFLHGTVPIHYFLPVFTLPSILYATYLARYPKFLLLLGVVVILNIKLYFIFQEPDDFIPYYKQEAVASYIVTEARVQPLQIRRVGPYDYFPEYYSQNYKYLILWKGGMLDDGSGNIYIIDETEDLQVKKL
jgi:hypothetical protein